MTLEQQRIIIEQSATKNLLMQTGSAPFTTVAKLSDRHESGQDTIWSALLPQAHIDRALSTDSWDLRLHEGYPGFLGWKIDDAEYFRFGRDDGIEPLVFHRRFDDLKPDEIEVSEEFRHYHNLWHDPKTGSYYRFSKSGEQLECIRSSGLEVSICTKALKQFLSAKNMLLAVFYTVDRKVDSNPNQLGFDLFQSDIEKGADFIFYWHIQRGDNPSTTCSIVLGKKLVRGFSLDKCGISPFDQPKENHEFIIGTDTNGEPVMQNCAPSTYNGRDLYLRTVFFRKDVLTRYYSEPDRFKVGDGVLRCGSRWVISIDNNHPKYVGIFLGDIARDLPTDEQIHWKQFNVAPESGPSDVSLARNFNCEFAPPSEPDLQFKEIYQRISKSWANAFGWQLFLPLSTGDEHHLDQIHIPVKDSVSEFDSQIISLSKLVVESINEEELLKSLIAKPEGSISRLKEWLEIRSETNLASQSTILRDIRALRNGVGHRKGKTFQKTASALGLDTRTHIEVCTELLTRLNSFVLALHNLAEREVSSKVENQAVLQ